MTVIAGLLVGIPLHFAAAFTAIAFGRSRGRPGGFRRSARAMLSAAGGWRWVIAAIAAWSSAASCLELFALEGGRTSIYRLVDGRLHLVGDAVDHGFRQMLGFGLLLAVVSSLYLFAVMGMSRSGANR